MVLHYMHSMLQLHWIIIGKYLKYLLKNSLVSCWRRIESHCPAKKVIFLIEFKFSLTLFFFTLFSLILPLCELMLNMLNMLNKVLVVSAFVKQLFAFYANSVQKYNVKLRILNIRGYRTWLEVSLLYPILGIFIRPPFSC